MNFYRLR